MPAHGFHIEGIEQITQSDFIFAREFGFVVKHLAVAKKTAHGVELRSHPTLLKSSSNLASLQGVRNGIQIDTDLLGEFHIAGSGAGQESTASGIISDLISRTIIQPAELPIGLITSAIGSPFFLWLIIKSKNNVN